MRILRLAERKYPRYVAERREGRLKGQYPMEIGHIPALRRQWDRGGFGTGVRLIEVEADSPGELIEQLRAMGINPQYDDVEFFEITARDRPKTRIPTQRFFSMLRNPVG